MRYAGLKLNDTTNCGGGLCVSLWTQGCPHRCPECHNPETWNFEGGMEVPTDIKGQIIKAISANGIDRNFSVLGGEPLCPENAEFVENVVSAVRTAYPHIKIYIWSGYTFQELKAMNSAVVNSILEKSDVLVDGAFEIENRDITLPLRGSSNQNIIDLQENFCYNNKKE